MVIRRATIAGPALLVLVAFAALLASLAFGGGADAPIAADPGELVRFGLPMAKLLVNLGAAGSLGALVLVVFALAHDKPEFGRALDVAAAASALWAVAAAATGFFIFLSVYSQPISLDARFGELLSMFMAETEIGKAWLITTIMAAVLTVLCLAVRNTTALLFVTIFAAVSLMPMASQGHTGGTADHDAAVTALWVHVVFAAVWLGGLITIILSPFAGNRAAVVVSRYSSLALVSFLVVASSGVVSALIRVTRPEDLLTPYGGLVLAKVAALVVLGVFGVLHRGWIVERMQRTGARVSLFAWLATAELAFMGLAFGVASALARTETPRPEIPAQALESPTPAELLTGSPLPPPPDFERFFTLWQFDLLWVLVCAFGIVFYLAGVVRLHRRGDHWPVPRTVLWVAGMLLLFYITNGGVNVYQEYLFSAHMLAHMTLGMMVPVLLVPGAPVTLALRTIAKRTDGSRGAREWIMLAVHSRYFGVLANPVVASIFFVASLWIFYYTPIFDWATSDHIGHQWMIVHFLATGYLFVQSLIGVDPVPSRPPFPLRLLVLLAVMAMHAFFGLAVMSGTALFAADWYGAMGWDIGISAIADQQRGGAIAWGVAEIPTVALAIAVVVMWSQQDRRETKRYDRKADRDGDAELEAYNEMLARRAQLPEHR